MGRHGAFFSLRAHNAEAESRPNVVRGDAKLRSKTHYWVAKLRMSILSDSLPLVGVQG